MMAILNVIKGRETLHCATGSEVYEICLAYFNVEAGIAQWYSAGLRAG
jgi:hypothetical protein